METRVFLRVLSNRQRVDRTSTLPRGINGKGMIRDRKLQNDRIIHRNRFSVILLHLSRNLDFRISDRTDYMIGRDGGGNVLNPLIVKKKKNIKSRRTNILPLKHML